MRDGVLVVWWLGIDIKIVCIKKTNINRVKNQYKNHTQIKHKTNTDYQQ